jgi:alkylation response protein AidB-like acyl-CoA dehydrogenase
VYNVARCLDLGSSGNGLDADGVKLFCGPMGKRVADRAIQVTITERMCMHAVCAHVCVCMLCMLYVHDMCARATISVIVIIRYASVRNTIQLPSLPSVDFIVHLHLPLNYQVLGGNGYVGEYQVERLWRDAKLLEIGGGTNEAHHKNMVRDIRKLYS